MGWSGWFNDIQSSMAMPTFGLYDQQYVYASYGNDWAGAEELKALVEELAAGLCNTHM